MNPELDITAAVDSRGRASWLEPRLAVFRTPYWQDKFLLLERVERLRLPGRDVRMMFFAERPASEKGGGLPVSQSPPALGVLALQNTLLRVLAGVVHVSTSSRSEGLELGAGTCLLARGLLRIRAVGGAAVAVADGCSHEFLSQSSTEAPAALWAVRVVDHQVIVEPQQHRDVQRGGDRVQQDYLKKIIIKKIYNCTDIEE